MATQLESEMENLSLKIGRDPLSMLPFEIVESIVDYLPPREFFMLRMVSKTWNSLCSSKYYTRKALDKCKIDYAHRWAGQEESVFANHYLAKPAGVRRPYHWNNLQDLEDVKMCRGQIACLHKWKTITILSVFELSTLRHLEYTAEHINQKSCFLSDQVAGIRCDNEIHWTNKLWRNNLTLRGRVREADTELQSTALTSFAAEAYGTMIVGLQKDNGLAFWVFHTSIEEVNTFRATTEEVDDYYCSLHAGERITIMWPSDQQINVEQYSYSGERLLKRSIPWQIGSSRFINWKSGDRHIPFCYKTIIRGVAQDQFNLELTSGDWTTDVLVDLAANAAVTFEGEDPVCFWRDRMYVAGTGYISSFSNSRQTVMEADHEDYGDVTIYLVISDGYLVQVVMDNYEQVHLYVFDFCKKVEYAEEMPGGWTWRLVDEQEKMVNIVNGLMRMLEEYPSPTLVSDVVRQKMLEVWTVLSVASAEDIQQIRAEYKDVLGYWLNICEALAGKSTAALALDWH